MGRVHHGIPLTWDETKKYADYIKGRGITQFLYTWDRAKDRHGDELLWGDEIEYMIIAYDHETKNAKLSLHQADILTKLSKGATILENGTLDFFHPEFGRYMIESVPASPYTGSIQDLLSVESNMHRRRLFVRRHLNANEAPITITSFPRMGTHGVFTDPYFSPDSAKFTHSLLLPDEVISPHPRYTTSTANIRIRRNSKVAINLPIFIDERTPRPFVDPTIPWQRSLYPEDGEAKNGAALIDHIYMDAAPFGSGCCCLQLTLQSCNVQDAKRMYDALIPFGPIMLALTAASPIWRGYLSDVDCRWNVLTGSLDDRTEEEHGRVPLKENKYVIPKSRHGSVDLYLSTDQINKPTYIDIDVPYDQEIYARLVNRGVDELISRHLAHMFIRDPVLLFADETVNEDDENTNHHFEIIQSTVWQTLRFKPPSPQHDIGWRVEFRSMEVQLTDFENAAFAVFIVLLSRTILAFNLNFYIPISKVDENMQRAQKRDAVCQGKFFFRKDVLPPGYTSHTVCTPLSSGSCSEIDCPDRTPKERKLQNCFPRFPPSPTSVDTPVEDEYEEMSIQDIFNGKGTTFPGLLNLVEAYLELLDLDQSESQKIRKYIDFVRRRANGSLFTTARWMREFVRSHPSYKFNSVVSQEINYDLMVAVDAIERGVLRVPELLPQDYAPPQLNGWHESK